jgi:hypothetical protein
MVVAISFIEAPLKFRAPGVTVPIGLGIGRLVFRALNACELVFAVVIALSLFTHEYAFALNVVLTIAIGGLFFQTVLLRPMLTRRTASVLAGEEGRRSGAHLCLRGHRRGQGDRVDRCGRVAHPRVRP